MPESTGRAGRLTGRRRGRVAAVTAAALSLAVLAGCTSGGDDGPKSAPGSGRQSAGAAAPASAWNREPASVAAVGDSMTRGFDACSVLADCPEVSWATGTDASVDSLALRLLGPAHIRTHSWNHAVSGARIAQLPEQMAAAAKDRPGLVTVMIGANDACRASVDVMTPVEDFRASFEASMRALRSAAPKTQVYVASVPDLHRLWSTGRQHDLVKKIWALGICTSMLGDADDLGEAATARRSAVRDRVMAYNQVLREVCAKDELCRHDGGAVFDYPFTGAQLSTWDWFHPGRAGQARLAEIAYRAVTARDPA
ncbi:SGNH/GDSL hydrolase family protein [uncultured Streptomyces sp.]|uniref:SGNH/GDSL hydrolase family protein n=1 Tax=uncultured Streptomyces sp. TaxID=174707 RepID=UPI002625ADED|nr:SGNH/GDSL hydrolase family protein [uncultured Streptomyces sp.]